MLARAAVWSLKTLGSPLLELCPPVATGAVKTLKLWLFQLVPQPRPSIVLNGRPLVQCTRPDKLQPTTERANARLAEEAKWEPRPNGRMAITLPTIAWRTSKSDGPRFPFGFQELIRELN